MKILRYIGEILLRNILSLIALIITLVVVLLFVFGELREAGFLLSALLFNIIIGTVQDVRSKLALEKLQALAVQTVTRVRAGVESAIKVEEVQIGDVLKLKLGDQIPADSVVTEMNVLEVSEALLTGESANIHKTVGDKLLSGSIVVAGSALITVKTLPQDSFVAKITAKVKRYSVHLSPIQRQTATFIKYMTYVLIVILGIIIMRGWLHQDLVVEIIQEIAALTGTVVPEGLVLATTLLFAYGAVRLYRSQVLLQEINATEKLGRIRNLCVDKTGTLTEPKPSLETVLMRSKQTRAEIDGIIATYIKANEDHSETMQAVVRAFIQPNQYQATSSVPFTSSRKYGSVTLTVNDATKTYIVGAPDILMPNMDNAADQTWLQQLIKQYSAEAKRLVLLGELTHDDKGYVQAHSVITPLAIFVLLNPLRVGTREVIEFFQQRDVRIRVISGDNASTVQAIAQQAGIHHYDKSITGDALAKWSRHDYELQAEHYTIFARVQPEQKEKLITAFKKSGFTAMIGDGANDALAIKKADLGITVLDSASVLRKIAPIILLNNSFSALPQGVTLADSIILTSELVAGIFFNKVITGLSLFLALSLFGTVYPIAPRNITVINYFTIAVPILYWSIFPVQQLRHNAQRDFLKVITLFAVISAALSTMAALLVREIGESHHYLERSHVLIVMVFIALGYWFFVNVHHVLGITLEHKQRVVLSIIALVEILVMAVLIYIAPLANFFGVYKPTFSDLLQTFGIIMCFGALQYVIAKYYFGKRIGTIL